MLRESNRVRPGKSVWTLMGLSAIALGSMGFVGSFDGDNTTTGPVAMAASAQEDQDSISILKQFSNAFSTVAHKVKPSVVSIHVEREASMASGASPFQFEIPGQQTPVLSGGTGIIVSQDGYILTNNHVVERAKTIKVRLSDGQEYDGIIKGTDPKTDLAVIKIQAKALQAAHLGNSDAMRVGEWVVAIGNPYNLDFTVTAGIVSAVGRSDLTRKVQYQDFIQTDASINPGNSGGPLVNLDGEVIGINTLIDGRGAGLGFSIPSNMAKNVMAQLIDNGRVIRPWLGVRIQSVDETLAKATGFDDVGGAFVVSVEDGSPAEKGGIEAEDIITAINSTPIHSANDLVNAVIEHAVGEKVVVSVFRDGKHRKLKVLTEELPSAGKKVAQPNRVEGLSSDLGIQLRTMTDELADELGTNNSDGVLVWRVSPNSPAYTAGLRQGDIIMQAAKKPVDEASDLIERLNTSESGEAILLKILRGDSITYVALPIP